MKKIIAVLISMVIAAVAHPQDNVKTGDTLQTTRVSKPPYYLDGRGIDPKTKTIVGSKMVGGANWDGTAYFTDTTIHYEKTSLIVLGCIIRFKEYFPLKGDMNNLRVISCNDGYVVFKIKDTVYFYNTYRDIVQVSVAGYKAIGDYIYQDKVGYLYFLFREKLEKLIGLTYLDTKTLRYVTGNYYADKNGLYFLDKNYHPDTDMHSLECTKIEDSHGAAITPVITANYFIYNSHVYANGYNVNRLMLDAKNLSEIEWGEYEPGYSITDGKKVYRKESNSYYYDAKEFRADFLAPTMAYFAKNNITLQKVFSPNIPFIKKDTNTLQLPFGLPNNNFSKYISGLLIKTSDGYYFLNTAQYKEGPLKMKNVLAHNMDTGQDEQFDPAEFQYLRGGICAYRNHLFIGERPMDETPDVKRIDVKHLKQISSGSLKTNYFTDGSILFYAEGLGRSYVKTADGVEHAIIEDNVIKGVDVKKLKIINKDRLIDDNYLYNGNIVIPIRKLGLDVKEFLLPVNVTAPDSNVD